MGGNIFEVKFVKLMHLVQLDIFHKALPPALSPLTPTLFSSIFCQF